MHNVPQAGVQITFSVQQEHMPFIKELIGACYQAMDNVIGLRAGGAAYEAGKEDAEKFVAAVFTPESSAAPAPQAQPTTTPQRLAARPPMPSRGAPQNNQRRGPPQGNRSNQTPGMQLSLTRTPQSGNWDDYNGPTVWLNAGFGVMSDGTAEKDFVKKYGAKYRGSAKLWFFPGTTEELPQELVAFTEEPF